jgi:hypothetical protein
LGLGDHPRRQGHREPQLAHHVSRPLLHSCLQRHDGLDPRWTIPEPDSLQFGGIIGVATITDCVSRHRSPWFFGRWGFVLADAQPVDFIEMRGELGIFNWLTRKGRAHD